MSDSTKIISPRGYVADAAQLREQYKDSSKLSARAAIYRFGNDPVPWLTWVFDQIQVPGDHARMLELGCGPAGLWRHNLGRIPASWSIVLSDLMPGMLREGRHALGKDASRFDWMQIDAQRLPFADGPFHAVIANHMLYHVPDRCCAMREMARVLNDGGHLYAATNGPDHLRSITRLVERFLPQFMAGAQGERVLSFRLDNGAEELRRWFSAVECRARRVELAIPDAQLIVNYVLSFPGARETLVGPALRELEQAVREQMSGGVFRATTDVGLFTARR